MKRTFATNDRIIPMVVRGLTECEITICLSKDEVDLQIGPRDFTWDRKTGEMLNAGTSLPCSSATRETVIAVKLDDSNSTPEQRANAIDGVNRDVSAGYVFSAKDAAARAAYDAVVAVTPRSDLWSLSPWDQLSAEARGMWKEVAAAVLDCAKRTPAEAQ